MVRKAQEESQVRLVVQVKEGRLDRRVQEESRVRLVVQVKEGRLVLKGSQDRKGHRVQQAHRVQEENLVHVVQRGLLAIRKTVYLHHL